MIEVVSPKIEVVSAIKWSSIDPLIKNPVSNTGHQYLKFINTRLFSEEARKFMKNGYYTIAPKGSKDYVDYWDEQERRCLEGYTSGGVRITGRHYFYLNFSRIKARPINPSTGYEIEGAPKRWTFPRFLDHQYYFFHELERCMAEGPYVGMDKMGMVILKSRRKGYTYTISAGVFAYNFSFIPASMNVLAAYASGHYKVTLDGIHLTLNHLNKSTDWAKRRDKLDTRDHFKASFVYKDEAGIDLEDGYMSEVRAISFMNDPFKSISESNTVIGFEEAGKFHNLLTAYGIAEPTLRDGDIFVGIPIVWGSATSMEAGTEDLAELFYNPAAHGFAAYSNIYEEDAAGECGFFVDDMWYYPGMYTDNEGTKHNLVDVDGNSIRKYAEIVLDKKYEEKKKAGPKALATLKSQQPKCPSDALIQTAGFSFDIVTAKSTLASILSSPSTLSSIRIGHMEVSNDSGTARFMEDSRDIPIREYPIKIKHKGAVEIYEPPVRDMLGDIQSGRYIASVDTYDDDDSETSSVGSMLVLDMLTDRIVAHYKGRPTANEFYKNCYLLAKYYNAKILYERNKKGLYGYFFNVLGATILLADQPEILTDKSLTKANTIGNNSKGVHATAGVNKWGVELADAWMQLPAYGRTEDSDKVTLQTIKSIGLLREIISFNPTSNKNYDDISALGLLMIYREDRLKFKPTDSTVNREKDLQFDAYFQRWKKQKDLVSGLRGSTRLAISRRKRF